VITGQRNGCADSQPSRKYWGA